MSLTTNWCPRQSRLKHQWWVALFYKAQEMRCITCTHWSVNTAGLKRMSWRWSRTLVNLHRTNLIDITVKNRKTLSALSLTTMGAIPSSKNARKTQWTFYGRNCLEVESSANEKTVAVHVTNSTEVLDFLYKVLSLPRKCTSYTCMKSGMVSLGIQGTAGDLQTI